MSKINFFDTDIEGRTIFKTAHVLDMAEKTEIFLAKYPEIHSIFERQFHPIKIIGHSIFLASPT